MKISRLIMTMLILVFTFSITSYAKTDEEVIKEVSEKEIMTGTNIGFEGEKSLTRAEVTTIVIRMKEMENDAVSEISYSDVDKEYWAYKYISIATKAGITKGTGSDTFSPNREVTVGETVTMLIRAIANVEEIEKKKNWPDNYMEFAKKYNLLSGITKGKNEIINRMDTARIISNIFDSPYYADDEEDNEEKNSEGVSRAACGVIVDLATLADEYNEVELAVPGQIVTLRAHNSELVMGTTIPGTYVDFWLDGTRMWDIEAEQKVTEISDWQNLAKIIKFEPGYVRLVRRPSKEGTEIINVNDTEYVDANNIIFLKCEDMTPKALGDDKYLREFEELEIGSEFDIELTSDYNDGLSYNEMDGTEVFYSSIMVKGEERIVSMIYVED